MSIESDKEAKILKFIKENEDCNTGGRFQTEYRGRLIPLEIYRLPIDLLTYNLENGRFAADKLAKEAELKRKLNPENKNDVREIKKLLLEKDSEKTNQLREDIMRIGQVNPGIITSAGNVINANRRMAVLSELKEKTGDEKYGYLLVGILPNGADAKDIWIAESKIQFGQEFKTDYTPINRLLKIRDAIKTRDMKEEEVANVLSMKLEDIKKDLSRLTLIERYLEYIGKFEEYTHIDKEEIHEHFINLQNNLESARDDFLSTEEQIKFLKLHFESIRAGFPHLFIRELKRIGNNEETKQKSFSVFDKLKNREIDLESFKDEVQDIIDDDKLRSKGEPKRLLQRAYSLLWQFDNNKGSQKVNIHEKNIFASIEEIIKKIKERE